ncbi:CAT RNA binding domain-containing protein [Vibrio sp. CDRSL-10 TSBA]
MFTIIQVLNNNVVSAADEKGQELILTGKGLGFKALPGGEIDPSIAEKVFRLNQGDATSERLKVLMESLPLEVVEITEFICNEAEKSLNKKFGNGLFVSLSDHLDFAIKRSKDGLSIPKPF